MIRRKVHGCMLCGKYVAAIVAQLCVKSAAAAGMDLHVYSTAHVSSYYM